MARLTFWVQPRAPRTEVVGRHGDAIKIKLAAPPVDGAANEELVRFVAETLQIRRSAVRILAGLASRGKVLEVMGMDADVATGLLLG